MIVDLRHRSPTYRQWIGVELSPVNGRRLYVPEVSRRGTRRYVDDTEMAYQMSHEYVLAAVVCAGTIRRSGLNGRPQRAG